MLQVSLGSDAMQEFRERWGDHFASKVHNPVDDSFFLHHHIINLLLPLFGDEPQYKPQEDPTANHLLWLKDNKDSDEDFAVIHTNMANLTEWSVRQASFSQVHITKLVHCIDEYLTRVLTARRRKAIQPAGGGVAGPSVIRRSNSKYFNRYRRLWAFLYTMSHEEKEDDARGLKEEFQLTGLVRDYMEPSGKKLSASIKKLEFELGPRLTRTMPPVPYSDSDDDMSDV